MSFKQRRVLFLFVTQLLFLVCSFATLELKAFDLKSTGKTILEEEKNNKLSLKSKTILRVYSQGSPGSAVVIGKINNTYTLLTANHVLGGGKLSDIEIEVERNVFINPISISVPFQDIDLAIITIKTDKQFELAILPFLDSELWEKTNEWIPLEIVGYVNESMAIKQATLRKSHGKIVSLLKEGVDGYNILYNSTTNTGMSGGAVFGNALNIKPLILDRDEKNYRYGYVNLSNEIIGLEKQSSSPSIWHPEYNNQAANITYSKCMKDRSWSPKRKTNAYESVLGTSWGTRNRDCIWISSFNYLNNCQPVNISPSDGLLLLAIHGRSEKYSYGGKSGTSLGIYLGTTKIRNWLYSNSVKLGLEKSSSYAKRTCKVKEL